MQFMQKLQNQKMRVDAVHIQELLQSPWLWDLQVHHAFVMHLFCILHVGQTQLQLMKAHLSADHVFCSDY